MKRIYTRVPPEERFWAKVEKDGDDGCWRWLAHRTRSGYGAFNPLSSENPVRAHRYAYELLIGPIPEGLQLDHLCRVRECVNPRHLEPVTAGENIRRGGNGNRSKTACPQGHRYTEANTYFYKKGRVCRTCVADLARKARVRKRGLLVVLDDMGDA